jgi:bacterial/archaeal transporter family-2 protein
VSKDVAVVATVVAGGFVGIQAPVNNVLSKSVGSFGAATVNFAVGLVCIVGVTFLLAGGLHGEEGAEGPTWYYWAIGGLAGATYVTVTLVAVRELGASGVVAATIAGQLTLAVVVDRLGIFGLEERAITWERLLGIALLALGTVLVLRE